MATGHIRKRQTKGKVVSYQIILETDHDPITGKRQRIYKTINGTKKEAEAMLDRMKNELLNNGEIIKPSAMKLGDWMLEWLKLYLPNIEDTTRAGYEERIKNKLIPYLGNTPLKSLQTSAIQQWVNTLSTAENLAPKSVKNIFLNLKAALDKAVILNMIPKNPCLGVELPKAVKYKANVYDDAEIANVLKVAEGTDMYLLITLIISVGFRRGEIVALQWSDIDFDNGIIHINKSRVNVKGAKKTKAPKTQSGIRDISVGENLLRLLKQEHKHYLERKMALGWNFVDSNCVICQKNGKAFSPDSITQKWERFCEANNLKKIRLHDLRHTCATAMLSAGISPKIIQTRLGHADISTTMNIYAHALPSMNKEAGDKMDAKILGDSRQIS